MLTSSTQLQNRSFHVSWKNENVCEMWKKWKLHVQSVQDFCFFIVKYANLWRPRYCRRRDRLSSLLFKRDAYNPTITIVDLKTETQTFELFLKVLITVYHDNILTLSNQH